MKFYISVRGVNNPYLYAKMAEKSGEKVCISDDQILYTYLSEQDAGRT